jgi:Flp pilus assembly pilin Flp
MWWQQEEGQDLIEYGLLTIFVSLAVMATLPGVGQAIDGLFANVVDQLSSMGS